MKQMDSRMARGAEAALRSGFKPIECTVHTGAGDVEAFIVSASRHLLTIEHEGEQATVRPDCVSVEDEQAELLRSEYERSTERVQAARQWRVA